MIRTNADEIFKKIKDQPTKKDYEKIFWQGKWHYLVDKEEEAE